jgi:hypothetical protein
MSTTSLNFHHVTEASARIQSVGNIKWMAFDFTDSDGAHLEVTLFSDSPEKLLEAIAAVSRPEQAKETDLLAALKGLMALESRGRIMPIGREWDAARAAVSRALDDAKGLAE